MSRVLFCDDGWECLVHQGNVWEEVEKVINEKQVDLLIIGTHGRQGFGKVLFGSVAEQIFRHADCPVLTVGPGSFQGPMVDATEVVWPFLFATDFGAASLRLFGPRTFSLGWLSRLQRDAEMRSLQEASLCPALRCTMDRQQCTPGARFRRGSVDRDS